MESRRRAVLVGTALWLASATAHAAGPGHEGFYLRAAIGGGRMEDSFSGPFGFWDGSATGPSVGFEALAGGNLKPGLILGGGLLIESVQDPEIEVSSGSASDVDVGTLALVGAFLLWYPNAEGGFHLGGALVGGSLSIRNEGDTEESNHQPGGGGAVLWVGWDWEIVNDWSLGVLGRLIGTNLWDDAIQHRVTGASILFQATYD